MLITIEGLDFPFFSQRDYPANLGSDEDTEPLGFVLAHQEKLVVTVALGPDFGDFNTCVKGGDAHFPHEDVTDELRKGEAAATLVV